MPRELVCLQVGQCGNQIGCKFWDLALQEHLMYRGDGTVRKSTEKRVHLDDAMSSFFRTDARNISDDGTVSTQNIKARAVPIDMEEGVLESLLQGNLKTLFDKRHCIAGDTSGCGNNWAVGHMVYGQQCLSEVMEKVRHTTEDCDSLQTFLMLHSLGGGTGSGFGTRVLQELADEYPSIYRFVSPVFPQENDDVVTSPYNSVLSLGQLIDHADCVLPVDNQQLADIAVLSQSPQRGQKDSPSYQISQPGQVKSSRSGDRKGGEAFASMNYIVASMLTNLTASMRFPGQLNVDLNELTTNLVPFPSLKFIYSSVAPIALSKHGCSSASRRVTELFRDAFSRKCQLLTAPEFKPTYFASCILLRGDVSLSDATSNVEKLRQTLSLAPWSTEGFKVGLCSVPACESPVSLLSLTNNSGIVQSLSNIQNRFVKLYNVQAHLHHYTEYLEQEEIQEAYMKTSSLIESYEQAAKIKLPDGMRHSNRTHTHMGSSGEDEEVKRVLKSKEVKGEDASRKPGRRWKEIKSTGTIPLGRIGHSICSDGNGNLFLWGGVNETIESEKGKYMDDFFKYDFHKKEWSQIVLSGATPVPRAFHSAVCYKDKVVIFGGCNGKGRFDEISLIQTNTGLCKSYTPPKDQERPPSRYCHTSVAYKESMLVFGGKCGGRNSNKRLKDMYNYNLETGLWSEVEATGTAPSSRSAHTSVVYGKKMLVFGGRDGEGMCCEDFYEYHLEARVWRMLDCNHQRLMRARHSAVVHNDSIIIFGGWSGKRKLNDLCIYNLDTDVVQVVHDNDEYDTSLPCRRECHTTVVVDNKLVLFGGRFRGVFMNDSFEYPLPSPPLKFLLRNWFVHNGLTANKDDLPPTIAESLNNYRKRFVEHPHQPVK